MDIETETEIQIISNNIKIMKLKQANKLKRTLYNKTHRTTKDGHISSRLFGSNSNVKRILAEHLQ